MSVVNSPNMSLPVPVVGVEPGPDYASDINNCMSVIDSHTHTPGSGVLITPAAIDINTDLSFTNSRLTSAKSITFTSQGSPLTAASPDTLALYASGADLYYNDGSGNQIRITQSGGVVGTPGSITGLVAPASASYVVADSTFVWQSDVNTPANSDIASLILRNLLANSKGLTLNPPIAMASDYSLVLPPLPMANSFMQLDTSGNITASIPLSKGLVSGNLSDTAGIVGTQLAAATVAQSNLVPKAVGVGIGFNTPQTNSTSTYVDMFTGSVINITTYGGMVYSGLTSDVSLGPGYIYSTSLFTVRLLRDGAVTVAEYEIGDRNAGTSVLMSHPPSMISAIDRFVTAGAHTYVWQIKLNNGSGVTWFGLDAYVYEL